MSSEAKTISRLNGLARRLLEDGHLGESDAREASHKAADKGLTLMSVLLKDELVETPILAEAASAEFGVPLVDVNAFDLGNSPVSEIAEKLLLKHNAMPLYLRGNQLYVAIANPTDQNAIDELAFSSGFLIEPLVADASQIVPALERALANADAGLGEEFGDEDEEGLQAVDFGEQEVVKPEEEDSALDDAPVVRFINKVLLDGIRKGASDIHFEPYEKKYRIRYRLDGVLQRVTSPPLQMSRRLSSRLKVMAGLDIAERRVPQDGRIKLNLSKTKSIDFRVSTCPTLFGEKVVLRILDSAATRLGVDQLGFEEPQKEAFLDAVGKPYGMIVVTGPTGSGKTVTLYTALNQLNDEGRNISTVEDPVEIRVAGINQVQQNAKQGMTFAAALRSFLRQDPDVIMVGEIRDLETAEIAIKAAQTGHLVLSTLHTNDASQSITRLVNMGVPSYNITSALNLVIAQRLVRKLHKCSKSVELPEEVLIQAGFDPEEIDEDFEILEPGNCSTCNDGYKGRMGIFEVMPLTEPIQQIILDGGDALEINRQARAEGFNDLRRSALNKVKQGVTGLIEINRVTKD